MSHNENKQTVLVLGGTGAQGGSIVDALLKHPEKWNIRVLSRNPQSEKAIELQKRGIQVVKGDFESENHDELVKSLEGVDFAFLLTNFWQPPFTKEAEFLQGKKFADAAKHSKLKAIVFSTLPHVEQITNGKSKVAHFDSKAEIEIYIKDLKLPYIGVAIGFYMQNFQTQFSPLQKHEKQIVINLPFKPEDRLPFAYVEEYGIVVASVLENYKEYLGRNLMVVTESIPIQNVAQTIQKVTGHEIHLSNITPENYAKLGFPHAEELAEMYKFFAIYPEVFQKDTDLVKKIIGKTITWEEFVEKNWKNFPIFNNPAH